MRATDFDRLPLTLNRRFYFMFGKACEIGVQTNANLTCIRTGFCRRNLQTGIVWKTTLKVLSNSMVSLSLSY
jgi:hypothetical protein